MDDKPLEVLPWGRTLEQEQALQRKKAQGRGGFKGCLAIACAIAFVLMYLSGYVAGRFGP